MSASSLEPGTLVIVAGRLGTVIGETRIRSAKGYSVAVVPDTPFESVVNFAQDWTVKPAEIGKNVCAKRRGQCFCGYTHIDHPEWLTPKES